MSWLGVCKFKNGLDGFAVRFLAKLSRASGKLKVLFAMVPLALLSVDTAGSAQGDIPFVADVTNNNACVIIVQRDGTLVPNTASTQLSSKLTGGQSGIADVYSIWRYEVSVTGPFVFSSRPVGGDDGVTFNTLFSGQSIFRGVDFAEQPGSNAVRLRRGFSITRINVNLIADRPDPFPAGNYQADATLRCE